MSSCTSTSLSFNTTNSLFTCQIFFLKKTKKETDSHLPSFPPPRGSPLMGVGDQGKGARARREFFRRYIKRLKKRNLKKRKSSSSADLEKSKSQKKGSGVCFTCCEGFACRRATQR